MLSPQNQIEGKITEVCYGAVGSVVSLDFAGNTLRAYALTNAVESLGLRSGISAYAVFRANSVELSRFAFGANSIRGIVSSIEEGAVSGMVTIQVASSVFIKSNSLLFDIQCLGLAPGVECFAAISPFSISIGVE